MKPSRLLLGSSTLTTRLGVPPLEMPSQVLRAADVAQFKVAAPRRASFKPQQGYTVRYQSCIGYLAGYCKATGLRRRPQSIHSNGGEILPQGAHRRHQHGCIRRRRYSSPVVAHTRLMSGGDGLCKGRQSHFKPWKPCLVICVRLPKLSVRMDGNHRIILSLLHVPFISDFPYVYLGVKFRGKEQDSLSADNPTFRGQPASTRQALHKHPFRGVQQCFYLVLGCIRIVMGVID